MSSHLFISVSVTNKLSGVVARKLSGFVVSFLSRRNHETDRVVTGDPGIKGTVLLCGQARSCNQAGVNPVPEGRPTTG